MFNVNEPPGYKPPSAAMLLRSTLAALALAGVILVTIVLPAEYGLDPTGLGTALGLTRMGEIKTQLAEEAIAEAVTEAPGGAEPVQAVAEESRPTPDVGDTWRDEIELRIAPDAAAELKLTMTAGDEAEYEWTANGATLNFDAHGHGGGDAVTYGKGRGAADDDGILKAPFDGHHGWFWRNRTNDTVALTLRTRGQYSELVQTR